MQRVAHLPSGVGLTTGAVVVEEAPVADRDPIDIADGLMYEGKGAGRGRAEVRSWRDGGLRGELCLVQPGSTGALAETSATPGGRGAGRSDR